MSSPLSGAQFVSLERKKQQALRGGTNLRAFSRQHLVPRMVEFEQLRFRARGRPEEIDAAAIEESFSLLLSWKHGVEEMSEQQLMALGPAGKAPWRQGPVSPLTASHAPLDAVAVPRALKRFFEWIQSPSFSQLHPLEQLTLSQMRLLEIYPFSGCEPAIFAFSCYYLLAADHLLPWYDPAELPRLEQAWEEAFQLNTEPMLRFHLDACERAYDRLTELPA